MAVPVTLRSGADTFSFDAEQVNGLDAWEVVSSLGVTLEHLLSQIAALDDEATPPLHLVAVARWLDLRQSGAPLVPFATVAAATTLALPAPADEPAVSSGGAPERDGRGRFVKRGG